jgi:hypothetical protein
MDKRDEEELSSRNFRKRLKMVALFSNAFFVFVRADANAASLVMPFSLL